MPLQLLLLRHAEAEEKKSGMVDFDRELTPKGVNQCLSLGEQLKKNNINPDYIISSPSARTKLTAKFVFQSWGIKADQIQFDDSIYHGDETRLLEIIHDLKPDHQCVVFIGHNPTITGLAGRLVPTFKSGLDTCDLFWIEFNTAEWSKANSTNSVTKAIISPSRKS
jgi:phosphohistidine phosphatase